MKNTAMSYSIFRETAIVAGSSRGTAWAIAQLYAEAGALVVVSSRKLDACQKVVDDIEERGGEAIAVECDMSDKGQVQRPVELSEAAFGPADM